MVQFTIVPSGRGYWIEAVKDDSSRKPLERYDNEAAAVSRLRMLQDKAEIAGPGQCDLRDWHN
jgi:hypothetical protein